MDGSSGVAALQQVLYPNAEYFASRNFITADVNAAIRGLKAGGAGEIVVTDAHGSGNPRAGEICAPQAGITVRRHGTDSTDAPDSR